MATADQVIPIQRLRTAIGVVGDDQDTQLIAYRNTAIAVVEQYTGRNILDRVGYESDADQFSYMISPNAILFAVPDVKSNPDGDDIVLNYRNYNDAVAGQTNQTMSFELTNDRIGLMGQGRDGILILPDDGESWDTVLRMSYPCPYIVVNVGIDSASMPAPWGDAVALIVRALLDGSAYDEISSGSVLDIMLGPWRRNAFMRAIR